MDVGGATHWSPGRVLSRREMLETIGARYGQVTPLSEPGLPSDVMTVEASAPAERFALPDGTVFGIIASTTDPFCRRCDRSRLTADGLWYLCLYAVHGTDLRAALRGGASPDELRALITGQWRARDDRGAETRLALGERRAFVPINSLKKDPHLEMHTRGG
jgi:cyclic pyranopterin phosphate synthase